MLKNLAKMSIIAAVFYLAVCISAFAQDDAPVRISFDRNSERIDIKTGKKLPDYTQAQRGSIQFYRGRLDTPENGFCYFFDGRRFQDIDHLLFIRKLPSIGCWAIATKGSNDEYSSGHPKQNCEIEHHAVSFIPLDKNGKPQPKVYVLLEDLELLQLAPYDHWLANDTQEQLEAKKGVIY
ncbi:MAG: hypothetical protein JXB48_02605 [Candidatus Latescibacteria bacterium]|nr:hypothetical protein [Candidatus Latescibacterota bacterium]